jgi:hypothetical protein
MHVKPIKDYGYEEDVFRTDDVSNYHLSQGNELRAGPQRGPVPDRQDGLRAESE